MTNRLTVAVALVAGLVGGLLTRYVTPPPVFAQTPTPNAQPSTSNASAQAPITNELRARSFTLVDQFNDAIGTFTVEPPTHGGAWMDSGGLPIIPGMNTRRGGPMRIVLRNAEGREIWSAGQSAIRPAAATLR